MSWGTIEGHDEIVARFRRALQRGRMASSFLFVGPEGVGKRTFALQLAQALFCTVHADTQLEPCGRCPACQQVQARSHPDLELISKPPERTFLPIELFIGDREHRMREGLCHRIALKPYCGGRKIAIIDDADFLNPEGANCLLKTLEEPPPGSLMILIGTSEQKQLPTIRSRCQKLRFGALPETTVARLLVSQGLVSDAQRATRLAALSGGSLSRALELDDPALEEFREKLLAELGRPTRSSVALSKEVASFVDEAGKEAPPRRERINRLLNFAAEFYRQQMRRISGLPVEGDVVLQRAVAAAQPATGDDAETAAACLEQCLEYQRHIYANANLATLIEAWIDEFVRLGARDP